MRLFVGQVGRGGQEDVVAEDRDGLGHLRQARARLDRQQVGAGIDAVEILVGRAVAGDREIADAAGDGGMRLLRQRDADGDRGGVEIALGQPVDALAEARDGDALDVIEAQARRP